MDFPVCLDREAIEAAVPHRAPILLIESAVVENERRARGSFTAPSRIRYWPFLIVEAIAQAGALLGRFNPGLKGLMPVLTGFDSTFPRPIRPGETVIVEFDIGEFVAGKNYAAGRAEGTALSGGELVCRGNISFFALPPSRLFDHSGRQGAKAAAVAV